MKRPFSSVFLAATSALLVSVPLIAHHGAATFQTDKPITLQGTVTEWLWANPHCFLSFDAKDDTGTVRNWIAETQNPTAISQRGWTRRGFKPGDQVTVTLQPVKDGQPVGRILYVVLANGQKLIAAFQEDAGQRQAP